MKAPSCGNENGRPTFAEIDLNALRTNYDALRALGPKDGFFCPMVKANAYGHGVAVIAATLRSFGAEWLGVALFEEGQALRAYGDTGRILVFGPFARPAEAFGFSLTPVLGSLEQLRDFAAVIASTPLSEGSVFAVHLEFNTGMNRLGLEVKEAATARLIIDSTPRLSLEGVCTHLAKGDDTGVPDKTSERQLNEFAKALESFRGLTFKVHALNSSGASNLNARLIKRAQLSKSAAPGLFGALGARPGIAIYGAQPPTHEGASLALLPVMTLKSKIVQFHRIKAGARVSYGETWQAARSSLIGVLPVGYGDGYFRALSNKGAVLVRGRRAPIVGTVCMDYLMLDLTDIERSVGEIPLLEECVLLGRQRTDEITADELATQIGTISYEIFTAIGARVPRVYTK